jgi:hypothetical protein
VLHQGLASLSAKTAPNDQQRAVSCSATGTGVQMGCLSAPPFQLIVFKPEYCVQKEMLVPAFCAACSLNAVIDG